MSAPTLNIAIFGASGRMGLQLLQEAPGVAGLNVCAALVAPESDHLGKPLGPGKLIASADFALLDEADVVIDFSAPEACAQLATQAAERGVAMVSGTTGLSSDQLQTLDDASTSIPILHAANFSIGVNLLEHLVELASRGFGKDADIEIFEAHHRRKVEIGRAHV